MEFNLYKKFHLHTFLGTITFILFSVTSQFITIGAQKQLDVINLNGINAISNSSFSSINNINEIDPLILALAANNKGLHNSINSEHAMNSIPIPLTFTSSLQTMPNQFQNPSHTFVNYSQQSTNGDILNSQQWFSSVTSIYGGEDPIIYLDYSSINDEILRKEAVSLVYFNANFDHCRNCHKFFNIWKELALDIRYWRQVVKMFAINCSDEDNIEVCRRAGVTQFPQVKFYWIMSNNLNQDGVRVRILGKSVHAMRHLIMDKILEFYNEQIPSSGNKNLQSPNAFDTQQQSTSANTVNPLVSLLNSLSILLSGDGIGSIIQNIFNVNNKQTIGSGSSLLSSPKVSTPNSRSSMVNLNSNNNNNVLNVVGSSNNANVKTFSQLINLVLGATSKKLPHTLSSNWPKLEQFEVSDTQQLINSLPLDESRNFGALLIMETQEFLYTGLEVMLDLNPYANQTYIARVRDERSLLSKNLTKRDDIQAPALIYVTPNKETKLLMTSPKYTNDEDLRRVFVRAFERKQIKYPVKRYRSNTLSNDDEKNSKLSNLKLTEEDEQIMYKLHSIYMNDLINTIRASLMEQVFRHPDISDDQYNALVKYVYVLINYFPFNDDGSIKFLKRLHTWLQNQVSPLDINEYKKQFHDIDDVLQQKEWIACKSLSNTKTIPNRLKKSNSLFQNPAQIGKVVSNITRIFRNQQQQVNKLKSFVNAFTTNTSSVMLNKNSNYISKFRNLTTIAPLQNHNNDNSNNLPAGVLNVDDTSNGNAENSHINDSPIERIIKSLTSGSLGSDLSILKLISTALTGGGSKKEATGKSKFAREYPCGAWKLSHVMVVNEFIKDSPRKDVKHIVLHSLYQYMMHFYACRTCGNRVSDVNSEFRLSLDDNLQDQSDSIMLLWKIHNRISKRLESESRPGFLPKIQFPSESLCPKCRPQLQKGQLTSDLLSTPNWHEKQVLNFLIHHYRPQSILTNTNTTYQGLSSSTNRSVLTTQNFISKFLYSFLTIFLLIKCRSYSTNIL